MTKPPPPDSAQVFDRKLLRLRRARAAASFADHGFLFDEVAIRLCERLEEVTRQFPLALELGGREGVLARHLPEKAAIDTLIRCDTSPATVRPDEGGISLKLAGDLEALPFSEGEFDLIISLLELHWVNDLPGLLLQVNHALKADGLFLAAFLGGSTLYELRESWMHAEVALKGGAHPRVSPFVDLRDAGALLQRAGFALPVADLDSITVEYSDPLTLMRDLRGMGESHAGHARARSFTSRQTLLEAARRYQQDYALPSGRVPATFEVIFLTAWAPSAEQP
ncbi:MAG: methyltransferase domain-containing protein, partial [Pseudomonadota bacterium]